MAPKKNKFAVPSVDKSFIEKILGQTIVDYKTSSGSKSGDNFMGTLLSLEVTPQDGKNLELVVKSVIPLAGLVTRETMVYSRFIAACRTFVKEIVYYERIRPILVEIWREKQDPEGMSFFTHPIIHAQFHDKESEGLLDFIAMDDLRPRGYKMADKTKSLTLEETTATLKGLALMHATSYALLNGTGPLSKELEAIIKDPGTFVFENGFGKDFIIGADQEKLFNDVVAKMVDIIGEIKPEVTSKLRKFADDGFEKMISLWKRTTLNGNYFRVLLHGDLWTNNILFKHEFNGGVQDVKLIDFQYNHLGNIYEDLQSFIYTSTTADFRKSNGRTCWQVYYKEFELVLKQLECPMPEGFSEEQFHSCLRDTMEYGFIFGLLAIPWLLGIPPEAKQECEAEEEVKEVDLNLEVDNQKTLDKMVEEVEAATRNSKIAQQRLLELIDEMADEGFL